MGKKDRGAAKLARRAASRTCPFCGRVGLVARGRQVWCPDCESNWVPSTPYRGKIVLDKGLEADRKGSSLEWGDITHLERRLMERLQLSLEEAREFSRDVLEILVRLAPEIKSIPLHRGGTGRLLVQAGDLGACLLHHQGGVLVFRTWFTGTGHQGPWPKAASEEIVAAYQGIVSRREG